MREVVLITPLRIGGLKAGLTTPAAATVVNTSFHIMQTALSFLFM